MEDKINKEVDEEIIDFVNKEDIVIGNKEISLVKKERLNYRIAHVWVFDEQNRLLIHKRPKNMVSYPNVWTSSSGGHVESGETYEQAAKREAEEELGLETDISHAFKLDHINPTGQHLFIDLWYCEHHNPENLQFDAEEIAEVKLISLEDLRKKMKLKPKDFNPEFIQLLDLWMNNNINKRQTN